jgi:hypothetical protein
MRPNSSIIIIIFFLSGGAARAAAGARAGRGADARAHHHGTRLKNNVSLIYDAFKPVYIRF